MGSTAYTGLLQASRDYRAESRAPTLQSDLYDCRPARQVGSGCPWSRASSRLLCWRVEEGNSSGLSRRNTGREEVGTFASSRPSNQVRPEYLAPSRASWLPFVFMRLQPLPTGTGFMAPLPAARSRLEYSKDTRPLNKHNQVQPFEVYVSERVESEAVRDPHNTHPR